jgi:putative phage-type endonuclease
MDELVNIIDDIQPEAVISESEREELIESAMVLLDDYMHSNPLCFADPSHHSDMCDEVLLLLIAQIAGTPYENEAGIEDELETIIRQAAKMAYMVVAPRRSFRRTFIRKQPDVDSISSKLTKLRNTYQPEQRTGPWYEYRYNLLSASNAFKCFGSESMQNQLIYEKCKPINLDKYLSVNTEGTLHHGQRYEPVSVLLYEFDYKTQVEDFGCIKHDNYSFIGASPDGINVDPSSSRFGRMLEIKNIVNREITGIPKYEYWVQMQLQMETCNLNECDFLETRFIEYDTPEDFHKDGTFCLTADGKRKGVILFFMVDGQPKYYYMPIGLTYEQFVNWETTIIESHPNDTWMKNIYWRLDQVSCVLVLRNKLWFAGAKELMAETWNKVLDGRKNGYEQYAPKKAKANKGSVIPSVPPKTCLINAQTFHEPEVPLVIDTSSDNLTKEQYLSSILNSD